MKLMSARWSLLILLVVGLVAATSAVNGDDGRWKRADDGSCYWDSTDSGDDQCDGPGPTLGRWKVAPDGGCVWDAEDSGPHQCTPPETITETGSAKATLSRTIVTSPRDRSVEVLASPAPDSTPGS
jgi:hypothetical protein